MERRTRASSRAPLRVWPNRAAAADESDRCIARAASVAVSRRASEPAAEATGRARAARTFAPIACSPVSDE